MRPENQKMKDYLQAHGIKAAPKFVWTGSMKGRWRLWGKGQKWDLFLARQLGDLGFTDFDGQPLCQFSGNGGSFSVCVRGTAIHREFLAD